MSNARDKANIPALNFSSTGIDDNATSTAITIDSSQNVGIGTTSTQGRLLIKTNTSGFTADPSLISSGHIAFVNSSGATAVPTIMGRSDNNGGLQLIGATNNAPSVADLFFDIRENDNTDYATTTGYGFRFSRYGNELMRLTRNGNLGIGTSSPGRKVVIYDNSDPYLAFQNSTTGTGTSDGLLIGIGSVNSFIINRENQPIFFSTNNTERMRIDSSGNVSVGTTTPYGKLNVSGGTSTDLFVVSGFTGGETNYNMSIRNPSTNKIAFRQRWFTTGQNDVEVMNFTSGNVNVVGAFSKGSGSFKIDHPLPEKTNTHHLVHSFVEAPQADNIYRGKIDLVSGTATVNIDTVAGMTEGTFVLLNRDIQCFTSNETGWTAVKGSVSGNTLTITAQDNTCTDTISWMVIGERQDQHMYDTNWTDDNGKVIVEPLKETETQP